ncbi:hypothetical protein [Streptomyces chengmaiensis]|uniref:hypothetical protein n=1 Tax=Streptomyces chengmaiensis TaxID=3040919 RepID=UPI00244ABD24|nr:hypothetical protein [Streptomyces chengmaiensis]
MPPLPLRALCAAAAVAALTSGCASTPGGVRPPDVPAAERAGDDLLKSAQHTLVTRCLQDRGLTLERKASAAEDRRLQAALFGSGPSELSLTLPTGHTVTAHTDGCLADARRTLYGDDERSWFTAEVTVNNLRAEAGARMNEDPDFQEALARRNRCTAAARTAAAERCAREEAELAEVRSRLEPELLAEVRTLRDKELTAYRQLRNRALHRALDVVPARS